VQQKLFVLSNIGCKMTAKALFCTDYETVTKTIIPQETFVATPVAHAVKVFIIMV
jgi:hypothetical protein